MWLCCCTTYYVWTVGADVYRLCHLEDDQNQPHKQNQRILYNTGWYNTISLPATIMCTCMCLSLCIGVFSDILNLIFRDKSSCQITSDGVKVVGNVDLESAEMKEREHILAKCLHFLRMLARYVCMYLYFHFMMQTSHNFWIMYIHQ